MYRTKSIGPNVLISGVLTCLLAASALAEDELSARYRERDVRESIENSDLYVFNTNNTVPGAVLLVRDFQDEVVKVSLSTSALTPDTAYSVWWAVFNNPEFCAVPGECAVTDLEVFGGDPRVEASVFWGAGLLADAFGNGNVSFDLKPGRTHRPLFGGTQNYGLRNLGGAVLHVVLRSHGTAGVYGTVAEQIGSDASSACPPSGCVNEFASFHHPQQ
jgi:hypothetical protein